MINPGVSHEPIGADVLPAVSECGRNAGRSHGMSDKATRLEQIRPAKAEAVYAEASLLTVSFELTNGLPSVFCEQPKPAAHTLQLKGHWRRHLGVDRRISLTVAH